MLFFYFCLIRFLSIRQSLISNDFKWNHEYSIVRTKARLKPIYQITVENRLCLTYKYDRKMRFIPEHLLSYQVDSSLRRSSRNSSHERALLIPFMSKTRCTKTILIVNAKLWNALDSDIVAKEFIIFRKYVKSNICFNMLCDKGLIDVINV